MWPRFTDATIAVAVRGLRGVIAAAAAGCAAAAKARETWRVCDMPATRTPVIEFEIVADFPLDMMRHGQPLIAPWVSPSVKRRCIRM